MNVVLAIIGSRGLGQPQRYTNEIYTGATLYPTWTNVAQFNFAIKELNAIAMRIQEVEREDNPDFDARKHLTVIIGDADGADEIGRLWAIKNQLTYTVIPAKWRIYGRSAGHRRNPDIIAPAKYVAAFWDGDSKGTEGGIEYARKHDKKLKVIRYLRRVKYLKRKVPK